jgi:hypothetical protein
MNENRTAARWFAGVLMVSAVVFGGVAPAEASDSGWNGTVAPANDVPTTTTTTSTTTTTTTTTTSLLGDFAFTPSFRDSGWNGT